MRPCQSFVVLSLCLSQVLVDSYVLTNTYAGTDTASLERLSQLKQTRAALIELLKQINAVTRDRPEVRADNSILVRGDNSIQEDETDYKDRGGATMRSEKRDMGIMPPWREFCRLAGLSHCGGYNY